MLKILVSHHSPAKTARTNYNHDPFSHRYSDSIILFYGCCYEDRSVWTDLDKH